MEKHICPQCLGKGRRTAGDLSCKKFMQGYNRFDDSLPCSNCGGQYQFGVPSGFVPLNHQGHPCVHQYVLQTVLGFVIRYKCDFCDDEYVVDTIE